LVGVIFDVGRRKVLCGPSLDFDATIARAEKMNAEVVKSRYRNPPSGDGGPNYWECWLRDPGGYSRISYPRRISEGLIK
jgi:hypothetical protein